MNNQIAAGLTDIFIGLLIIALCVPLVLRKIKMNHWYGIRIPKAFASSEDWYAINEYGGKVFICWSMLSVVMGIAVLILPPLGERGVLVVNLAPALFIVLAIVQVLIYSRKC